MNRISYVFAILFMATAAFAQGPQIRSRVPQVSPNANQPLRPRANADRTETPIQDIVEGFFVSQLQRQVELNDDQFARMLPIARQYLNERRELTNRKTRALNALRQMIASGGEDQMRRALEEVDRAESGLLESHQRMLADAGKILSVPQQARLRVFLEVIPNQLARMIERARRGNAGPRP